MTVSEVPSRAPADHADDDGPCMYSQGKHCAGFGLETRVTVNHAEAPEPEPTEVIDVNHLKSGGQPFGFFDRNPALDVPPSSEASCHT